MTNDHLIVTNLARRLLQLANALPVEGGAISVLIVRVGDAVFLCDPAPLPLERVTPRPEPRVDKCEL